MELLLKIAPMDLYASQLSICKVLYCPRLALDADLNYERRNTERFSITPSGQSAA